MMSWDTGNESESHSSIKIVFINPIPPGLCNDIVTWGGGLSFWPSLPYNSVKSYATIKNLFPGKIFDIQISFGTTISTIKEVWPFISVCQSQSLPVYWDFPNWKNTKGSSPPLKNVVSDITQILYERPFNHKVCKFWGFFQNFFSISLYL